MRTLARPRDRADIGRRLRTLDPAARPHWGRMSAHQMVCHLRDAMLMMTGERRVTPATGPLQRTVIKWVALYLPITWPTSIATTPELDQTCGGTRPATFGDDLAQLLARIAAADRQMPSPVPVHPIFGRMSGRAWLRWAYLHADHHLRQFGA